MGQLRQLQSQAIQNKYQGSRVGENIGMGKLPSHYEMMTDYAWLNSNLDDVADVVRGVEGENYLFTQVLPPAIFKQNRVDGVGVWSYSVVKDNSFRMSRMGFRYMNELIPNGTWKWVESNLGYKMSYTKKAADAFKDDEYETTYNLLTSVLPDSTLAVGTSEPNLKSLLIEEVSALEAKTGIPRHHFTLSLSRDALDMMQKEEIVAQNLYAAADTESSAMITRNPWGVGNIVEVPRGGHDRDVLYMIHIKSMCKAVVFTPETAPGFYGLQERNGSPQNMRYVAEDGFTVDYFDPTAGVIMRKSRMYEGMPVISFISSNKALEIPTGATIDLAYLTDNYGLNAVVHELDPNKLGEDITDQIVIGPEVIDTSAEGIIEITLTCANGGLTTTDKVIAFIKDGAVPPTEQVALKAELKAAKSTKATAKKATSK